MAVIPPGASRDALDSTVRDEYSGGMSEHNEVIAVPFLILP
jgi:hypothetical protein